MMKKILLLLLFPILLLEHANAGLFTKKTTDPEITALDNYAKQFKATSDACAQASTAIQAKIDGLTKNGAGGKGGDSSTIAFLVSARTATKNLSELYAFSNMCFIQLKIYIEKRNAAQKILESGASGKAEQKAEQELENAQNEINRISAIFCGYPMDVLILNGKTSGTILLILLEKIAPFEVWPNNDKSTKALESIKSKADTIALGAMSDISAFGEGELSEKLHKIVKDIDALNSFASILFTIVKNGDLSESVMSTNRAALFTGGSNSSSLVLKSRSNSDLDDYSDGKRKTTNSRSDSDSRSKRRSSTNSRSNSDSDYSSSDDYSD